MATIQREVRKRGFFGKLAKFLFIAFNLLMLLWLITYWVSAGNLMSEMQSEAERAGGAVGATLATGMLLFFWVAGALILGLITLFTRGQRTLITEDIPGQHNPRKD
jgi:NADH:ubiquinone oxidoreductase subunit 6 (subunit J)